MNRREFVQSAIGATLIATVPKTFMAQDDTTTPWYRRTIRWGQTNITERDPSRYDIEWWREYWKRTAVQGVVVTAGGIVAYYPSKFTLHGRGGFLGDRDLYGEMGRCSDNTQRCLRRL